MSGVVGWIDFSRGLVRDRPIVAALTATPAQRGPDSESVWVSRAVLGFRPPAVEPDPEPATPVSTYPGNARRLGEEPEAIRQPRRVARDRTAHVDVELILQLNLWLEDYRVRLAL